MSIILLSQLLPNLNWLKYILKEGDSDAYLFSRWEKLKLVVKSLPQGHRGGGCFVPRLEPGQSLLQIQQHHTCLWVVPLLVSTMALRVDWTDLWHLTFDGFKVETNVFCDSCRRHGYPPPKKKKKLSSWKLIFWKMIFRENKGDLRE